MTFEKFQARVSGISETKGMAYTYAVLWLNPHRLPAGLISMRGVKDEIIRIPERVVNEYGNHVPVINATRGVLGQNENLTDLILTNQWYGNIYNGVLKDCTKLERITLPKSIKEVSKGAFLDCVSLKDVYYEGTEEEWNKIKLVRPKRSPRDKDAFSYFEEVWNKPILGDPPLLNATIHFNCKLSTVPVSNVPDAPADVFQGWLGNMKQEQEEKENEI